MNVAFMAIMAGVITIAVPAVGTLLIFALVITPAVAMPIFTTVKYGDVVSGLAFSVVLAVVWACQLMYAKSKAKAEAETRTAMPRYDDNELPR